MDTDRLAATAGAIRARYTHEVRIGLYGVALSELTHPVIEAFCERYPHASVRVHDADFHRGIDPLLAGEYDVALLRENAAVPSLVTVPIFTEPAFVALWKGHPLTTASSVDVAEVFDQPWVTPDVMSDFWVCGDQRNGVPATIGSHARSVTEMTATVAYQHMVGLTPMSGPRMYPHPGVSLIPPKEPIVSVATIAYPATGFSPAAPAFAEVARRVARRKSASVPFAEFTS
jgi:DNA-binding transcriptional LysR family regulator